MPLRYVVYASGVLIAGHYIMPEHEGRIDGRYVRYMVREKGWWWVKAVAAGNVNVFRVIDGSIPHSLSFILG